jgi:hypothetical protein
MMKSFIALVTPFDPSLKPDQGLPKPQPPTGGQPPKPDNTLPGAQPIPDHGYLPHPEHPIYYPLPPGAPVYPDIGLPGDQPHPDQGLPGSQPRPDNTLPGSQPKPDQGLPGPQPHPEHPIVLPPDSGGWEPVYIWGPGDPRPTPPIALPPEGQPPTGGKVTWKAIWTPQNGWQTIGVVIPSAPTPTPSKK